MKILSLLLACLLSTTFSFSARIISGPIPYHFTENSLSFGLLLDNVDSVKASLIDPVDNSRFSVVIYTKNLNSYKGATPVTFVFDGLKSDYAYQVELRLNAEKASVLKNSLKTSPISAGKDFSFMLGSCAFTPPRTLKWVHPGIEERIYPAMIAKKTDFMLWMGDYLYYFRKHFNSFDGMMRRHIFKRKNAKTNKFLMSRPQYAAWDDHDYGPDNATKDFAHKESALEMWKMFWNNPGYGLDTVPGCFFKLSYQDCDFFMLDNRYYRTEESIEGAEMLGAGQLEWLQQGLKASKATFKFIMAGSQVFNELTKDECYCKFPEERNALIDFINSEKIAGIIWLSGDRHHSSMFKVEDIAAYPFYEYTCSAITTFRSKLKRTKEYINPIRLEGTLVQKQNFGIIKISGPKEDRKCLIETFDNRGKLIWDYTIAANELQVEP